MSTWGRLLLRLVVMGLCAAATMTSSRRCAFPAYMTRTPLWSGGVDGRATRSLWRFTNRSVAELTDYTEYPTTTSHYSCVSEVDRETVLAGVSTTAGATDLYQCLRFIPRSDYVVQLARSTVFASGSADRCLESDRFELDDWVLVQPSLTATSPGDRRSCGLVGGYWVAPVDPSTGRHTCRDTFVRPIVESDCAAPGEGVLIDFRTPTCAVPSIPGVETMHRLVCLGSWTESATTFTVLTDNKVLPAMYMLTFPAGGASARPITARFLTSLSTSPAHHGRGAYDLVLTAASFPTLCENEATGCDVTAHCGDDSPEVDYCRKECGACAVAADDSPPCQFGDKELGQWLEMSRRYAADDDDDDDASTVRTVCAPFCLSIRRRIDKYLDTLL